MILSLFMAACAPKLIPISMFENPQCVSACWQNLRPGVSTQSEVVHVFSSAYNDFRPYYDVAGEYRSFISNSGSGGLSATIYFDPEQDSLLKLYLNAAIGDGFDLNLSKIIATLGESKYTYLSALTVEGAIRTNAAILHLYYPEDGYIFEVEIPTHPIQNDTLIMCPEETSLADAIFVLESGTIENAVAVENIGLVPKKNDQDITDFVHQLKPWSGFVCTG
jgi:hypothetical protein